MESFDRSAAHTQVRSVDLTLADYLAQGGALAAAGAGGVLYWQGGASELGDALAADVSPNGAFALREARGREETLVWLSTRNATAHAHVDLEHNFFAQVACSYLAPRYPIPRTSHLVPRAPYLEHTFICAQLHGTKAFELWPPRDMPRLQLHPSLHSRSRQSSIKSPAAAVPPPIRVELQPGQLLYLPPLWAHQVGQ